MNVYLGNVRNAVHRNLRHYMKHEENKEEFLTKVIEYCDRLLNDPTEPKTRKRIRTKQGYYTRKEVIRE